MNWESHLQNLVEKEVVSAAKALDYLDGDQIKHVEKLLSDKNTGIEEWRKRGIIPVVDNITVKVITRSALVYQEEPERSIYNGGETEDEPASIIYSDIIGYDGSNAMQSADIVSRLLKVSLVLCQYVEQTKEITYSILHRGNCDVDYDLVTRQVKSIMYTAGGYGPRGGQLYHYWDDSRVVDIEVEGNTPRVVSTETNPYGMIPVVVRYDVAPPRSGFWPREQWQDLIRLNEVINLFHTEIRHGSRMQIFSPLFTNAKIPDGTVIAADAVVEMSGNTEDLFLEYKLPPVNIQPFMDWLESLKESIADTWGVRLEAQGVGAADSGFKLTVQETWNLETRKQRQKAARMAERQLFTVIKKLSDTHGLGIPANATVYIDFAEPRLASDVNAERQEDRADLAAGLKSKEQIWREKDPDLSDEDIAKRKAEIGALKLPTFGNINVNTQ